MNRETLLTAVAVVAIAATPAGAAVAPHPSAKPAADGSRRPLGAASIAAEGGPTAPSWKALAEEQEETVRSWERQLAVVSRRDRSRLASLRRWVELQYEVFGKTPEEDPGYDDFRSFLKGAYEDLYRDHAEAAYPIEEAIDRALERRFGGSRRTGGDGTASAGWRPRLSPQAGVRSHGSYVGTKLSWTGGRASWRDHLSLTVRTTVEGETALRLKFDDGPRYLELGALEGDPDTGRRVWLTARWVF